MKSYEQVIMYATPRGFLSEKHDRHMKQCMQLFNGVYENKTQYTQTYL